MQSHFLIHMTILLLFLTWWKIDEGTLGVSFIRFLIPFMRIPPSRPNHPPKPHLLRPLYWGLVFQHMKFGEDKHIHSITAEAWPEMASSNYYYYYYFLSLCLIFAMHVEFAFCSTIHILNKNWSPNPNQNKIYATAGTLGFFLGMVSYAILPYPGGEDEVNPKFFQL